MYIFWKQNGNGHYAYLMSAYWDKDKKAPRTKTIYLGNTLSVAVKNLEKTLSDPLHPFESTSVKIELLQALRQKAPAPALLPPVDKKKQSLKTHLEKLKSKLVKRPDLAFIINRAIEKL
jgi:hypothetical protein